MKEFTNINIKKEKQRMIRNLLISILVVGIALICWTWRTNIIEKVNSEIKDLHSIIVNENKKKNKKAYIDIKHIPYQCAVIENTTDSYYIVSDGKYMYIAFMELKDFNKLNNDNIKNKPIRIEGITREFNEDVKKVSLEVYNEVVKEAQLTESEFDNYFGVVYLDTVMKPKDVAFIPTLVSMFIGFFGFIGLFLTIQEIYSYKHSINEMNDYVLSNLDKEMNSPNALYYDKAHLYLTNNYIINFKNKFVAINYNDIVWMYYFEQRTNGIKASQSIKVVDKTGKAYTVAEVEFITKAKKDMYNEIWDIIFNKNDKIILGTSKEIIKEIKDRFNLNKL